MNLYALPVPHMPEAVPVILDSFSSTITTTRGWRNGELESVHQLIDRYGGEDGDPLCELRDELSDYVKDRQRDVLILNKSVVESRVAQCISLTSNEAFETLHSTVIKIGRVIHRREHVQRRHPTTSIADPQGNKVVYCEHEEIEAHIQRISISSLELRHRSPVLAAIYVMVAISAVHPIRDGNGRLGRILFNMVMQADYGAPYIPLYELGQRSDGGWLLALRRAQIQNDWDCISSYIVNAVKITAQLQAASVMRHPDVA